MALNLNKRNNSLRGWQLGFEYKFYRCDNNKTDKIENGIGIGTRSAEGKPNSQENLTTEREWSSWDPAGRECSIGVLKQWFPIGVILDVPEETFCCHNLVEGGDSMGL